MSLKNKTELLRINNHLCYFSNDGKFLALALQSNAIIKNIGMFDTFQSFVFSDIIEYMEWSPNSEYILCANKKKAVVQIYSLYCPQWKYKLIEGSAGLENVSWSPDSKYILTLAEFNIQVAIWSLENHSVLHIQNLKSSAFTKLIYSSLGDRLSLITTDSGQDSVEIYKTNNWKISRKLICKRLNNIDGICWSPNNDLLCIWCSLSNEPKLIIYSTLTEKNVGVFCPSRIINPLSTIRSYTKELKGIENIKWIPSGQLLAVIGFNEVIVLLNYITWKPILQLHLQPVINENNQVSKVYKEYATHSTHSSSTKYCSSFDKHSLEECSDRPINIRISKNSSTFNSSIAKADILEFSTCGKYLAIKHQLYPSTLWIWNIIDDYLDYLLLQNTIIGVKWNPMHPYLFVFCECTYIFEWTPNYARCVQTPNEITILDAHWHSEGEMAILCGYNKAVIYQVKNKF